MGNELFGLVTDATGLPGDVIKDELTRLLAKAGVAPDDMTLDDLRKVLADYVQDILLAAKDEHAESRTESA